MVIDCVCDSGATVDVDHMATRVKHGGRAPRKENGSAYEPYLQLRPRRWCAGSQAQCPNVSKGGSSIVATAEDHPLSIGVINGNVPRPSLWRQSLARGQREEGGELREKQSGDGRSTSHGEPPGTGRCRRSGRRLSSRDGGSGRGFERGRDGRGTAGPKATARIVAAVRVMARMGNLMVSRPQ